MSLKLISHVNGDSDLIEAWVKYYLQLGVERFHLVVHGDAEENRTLHSIKDSYPITIEDAYSGPFHIDEKKKRLNVALSRHTGQWVLLLDSDEFVEFPYDDIPTTIRELESVHANLIAAPMLQHLMADGSLETPPVIEDPFRMFPLCSVDLYRKMGVKGDIFKFPVFFCAKETQLADGGNHHPPLGSDPRFSTVTGVTHHFKFRRTVSERLEHRIHSEHPWRHESVQFREYLESHGNRLPLEGAFTYSRDDLFQRKLLRKLSVCSPKARRSTAPVQIESIKESLAISRGRELEKKEFRVLSSSRERKILFVLPRTDEIGGLERHLFDLLARIQDPSVHPLIVCFDKDTITEHMDSELLARVLVKCVREPQSLRDWRRMIRQVDPDTIVFCYSWIKAFSWKGPLGALLAGVRRRFSIQHLIPPMPPPPVEGKSPVILLKRLIGGRARQMLQVRLTGFVSHKTICVCNTVRESLIRNYQFPPRKTMAIRNGVATSKFAPCESNGAAVRAQFDLGPEEFLLVCVARLSDAKGVDIVLHAVSRVLRQGISCKCIILGDGPLREKLMQEANSLGLSGYVFFEGFQSDVRPYLQAASAFILTSHLEGLPLSVLEAMSCGLPCVVTDVGGSAEAVDHQVTGLVIPPGSLDAAEEAILYLVNHPRERAAMASKSRKTVCEKFDIEKSMGELAHVVLS